MDEVRVLEEETYDSKSGKGFKRIFKNFGLLTFGKIGGDFFNFILFVVLSREFGEKGIGEYSFAIGFTGFFATLAQFGLSEFTIKEISKNKNSFTNYFSQIFSLNIIQSGVMILLLLIIVPFLNFSIESKIILLMIGFFQIIYYIIDIHTSVFIAYEQMRIAGSISVTTRIITAVGAILISVLGGSIILSLLFLPLTSIVQLFIVRNLVNKKLGKIKLIKSINSLKTTFKSVVPFGISNFLFQVYSRIDIVLIGFILGEASVGIYNVGYRVIFFLLFIPNFSAIALFPIISKLFHTSVFEFKKMYNKSLGLMIIIGFPVSAGLWLISPQLIEIIFGSGFRESSTILRIFSSLFLIKCMSTVMEFFLMSSDNQKELAKAQFITTIFSFVSTFILVYLYGLEGVALATLLTSIFILVIFTIKLKKVVGLPEIKYKILVSVLGVAAFYLPFSFLPSLSMFIIIPASIIIYVGTILLFRDIRNNELRMFLSLIGIHEGETETIIKG
jgi:O-antigen/teichoic acid export membrane protein